MQAFVTVNDLPKAVECYDKIGDCSRATTTEKVNALREAMELSTTLQVGKFPDFWGINPNS